MIDGNEKCVEEFSLKGWIRLKHAASEAVMYSKAVYLQTRQLSASREKHFYRIANTINSSE